MSWIDTAITIAIVVVLGWILYKPFAPALSGLWDKIRGLLGKVKGEQTMKQERFIRYE